MSREIIMKRIKRDNYSELNLLGAVIQPEVLHKAVPRLESVQEARVELQNTKRQMHAFGSFSKGTQFNHVAQMDQSIWAAILNVFARFAPDGQPMDDGLLYTTDEHGKVKLNRSFFYTLIQYLEAHGYKCDMQQRKSLAI